MTCEEFKKCNSNGVEGVLRLTRAERSAAAQHWTECFECRDWTNTFNFKLTYTQQCAIEQTKTQDQQDPETFRLPLGEEQKFDLDKEQNEHTHRP